MEWRCLSGQDFYLGPRGIVADHLEPWVYDLRWDTDKSTFYLRKLFDAFALPAKIYDFDDVFINRVRRTWEARDENLGILLSGTKGSGKSVTAKAICNVLREPTITIGRAFNGFGPFLSSISQPIVVLIDEFEKTFPDKEQVPFLSLLDGVNGSTHKRMYLLTSNLLRVNYNFTDRPGRIRYLREYKNLSKKQVETILRDRLVHAHRLQDTLDYISHLEVITVDTVCKVVDEVNLFDEPPSAWKDVMNCKELKPSYAVMKDGVRVGTVDETEMRNCRDRFRSACHIVLPSMKDRALFKSFEKDHAISESGERFDFVKTDTVHSIFRDTATTSCDIDHDDSADDYSWADQDGDMD
jgi:hypothetical protein